MSFLCLVINGHGVDFSLKIYGITGDCPALKSICNFIGHNGYYCCYFCFIRGEHIHGKRQYRYESLNIRTQDQYLFHSLNAEKMRTNEFGHLGQSVLVDIMDISFPQCIVLDYLHVSLLGHAKNIILALYRQLSPAQRKQFDDQLKKQCFPRKFRSLTTVCFVDESCVSLQMMSVNDFRLFQQKIAIDRLLCFCEGNRSPQHPLLRSTL
jgi:hypothetical protein